MGLNHFWKNNMVLLNLHAYLSFFAFNLPYKKLGASSLLQYEHSLLISPSSHTNNQYESRIFATNFCLLTLLVNIGKIKVLN